MQLPDHSLTGVIPGVCVCVWCGVCLFVVQCVWCVCGVVCVYV